MELPLLELMTTPFDDLVRAVKIQIAVRNIFHQRSILSKHIRNLQFISQLDIRENKLNLFIRSFFHSLFPPYMSNCTIDIYLFYIHNRSMLYIIIL